MGGFPRMARTARETILLVGNQWLMPHPGKSLAEIYANSLASLAKFDAFRLFGLSDTKGFVVSFASHGELTSSVKTRSSSYFSIFSSYIFHIYAGNA